MAFNYVRSGPPVVRKDLSAAAQSSYGDNYASFAANRPDAASIANAGIQAEGAIRRAVEGANNNAKRSVTDQNTRLKVAELNNEFAIKQAREKINLAD